MTDTVTVGFCGMGSCPGSNVVFEWQDFMFNKMDEGFTIKESFDLASAEFPTIADCVDKNQNPHIPTITGPTTGKPGVGYDYIFNAVDPDDDNVKYFIDWDDGDPEETGFNPSGDDVKLKNTWNSKGTYTIRAYAEDTNGLVGPEGTLTVTLTKGKNRAINTPFQGFLQSHPYLFPILRLLFQRLGLQN
jgi:hypothetical protein